ncbi:MAG: hypothetical protein H6806_08925 [Planctomycetes bacterium]|nr:hypothetical protein [Planctomycetota bacterium]
MTLSLPMYASRSKVASAALVGPNGPARRRCCAPSSTRGRENPVVRVGKSVRLGVSTEGTTCLDSSVLLLD